MCRVCGCGCYRGGIVVIDVFWRRLCVSMIVHINGKVGCVAAVIENSGGFEPWSVEVCFVFV